MVPRLGDTPLKDRIDQLTNINPNLKRKRLKQWMRKKFKEVKQELQEKKKRRRLQLKKKMEKYRRKQQMHAEYLKKKEEEEELRQIELVKEQDEEREEQEYQQKIQEGAQKLYKSWMKIKENADHQKAQEQKQIEKLEQQMREKLGEKMFQEWLKKERKNRANSNKPVISVENTQAVTNKRKTFWFRPNLKTRVLENVPINDNNLKYGIIKSNAEKIKKNENIKEAGRFIPAGSIRTLISVNHDSFTSDRIKPSGSIRRNTNVTTIKNSEITNMKIDSKTSNEQKSNIQNTENAKSSIENARKPIQRTDCWWKFKKT